MNEQAPLLLMKQISIERLKTSWSLTRQVCITREQLERVNPIPNALHYDGELLTDRAECNSSSFRHAHKMLFRPCIVKSDGSREPAEKKSLFPVPHLKLESWIRASHAAPL